jgi:CMP-N,N'-diacetyllegionaminic acid synthase
MYKDKIIYAYIPARGGSERIKGKNMRVLNGQPLLYWTISEALKSKYIDEIVVSSDSEEILDYAKSFGCTLQKRPAEFSRGDLGLDKVMIWDSQRLRDAKDKYGIGYDYYCLLYATNPLKTAEDIDGCIRTAVDNQCSVDMTIETECAWGHTIMVDGRLQYLNNFVNTQESFEKLPKAFGSAGGCLVFRLDELRDAETYQAIRYAPYVVDKDKFVDINTDYDFALAEFIMNYRNNKK